MLLHQLMGVLCFFMSVGVKQRLESTEQELKVMRGQSSRSFNSDGRVSLMTSER